MSLAQKIAPHLPYLRRYARALTGHQDSGDAYVAAVLEAIVAAPGAFPPVADARLGLYRMLHAIWDSARVDVPDPVASAPSPREASASRRLSALTPMSRQALLLTSLEGFGQADAAYILDVDEEVVGALLRDAVAEIDRQVATRVLIIEDEPIIAMDIESIVRGLGHDIVGVAATRSAAVELARAERPGLVLADIQLADGSSGIDAVHDILGDFEVPVIFITAYPDRLLTGERPEPTFLITKPFHTDTVRAAVSQALFFESTAQMA
ncbi:MAG: response regulator [Alphaproteobacteria bacterium]|nr:response regulator [Alphaproteobacteria bacterium]MDX5367940.1 response regulator [Alphaproteobacteria bacterium]MDX5462793.1 response regulator [Alphaproteobacteria bacterium]